VIAPHRFFLCGVFSFLQGVFTKNRAQNVVFCVASVVIIVVVWWWGVALYSSRKIRHVWEIYFGLTILSVGFVVVDERCLVWVRKGNGRATTRATAGLRQEQIQGPFASLRMTTVVVERQRWAE
jgi:hypothetical protein